MGTLAYVVQVLTVSGMVTTLGAVAAVTVSEFFRETKR